LNAILGDRCFFQSSEKVRENDQVVQVELEADFVNIIFEAAAKRSPCFESSPSKFSLAYPLWLS
jgi:hypothetical protein